MIFIVSDWSVLRFKETFTVCKTCQNTLPYLKMTVIEHSIVMPLRGHSLRTSRLTWVTQAVNNVPNKMTFPETDAPLRSYVSFDEVEDDNYHKGNSPFTGLGIAWSC